MTSGVPNVTILVTGTTPGPCVHIITRKRLRAFAAQHKDAARPLDVWFHIMRRKRYTKPSQVRADFPTASFIGDTKTVFDIGGNKYRLVVDMRYDLGRVFIRHVLTHGLRRPD